ncbi:hypothetical protein E2C01_045169 [Portunus trituberculatus]|uniref:Uncharacterized protein n=1 Tax=Portunus trituberculatus TaxID=210409 RepID=A0A5B7G189_PORTR|nr:hypothetical protein [Portunus trituberculatus]
MSSVGAAWVTVLVVCRGVTMAEETQTAAAWWRAAGEDLVRGWARQEETKTVTLLLLADDSLDSTKPCGVSENNSCSCLSLVTPVLPLPCLSGARHPGGHTGDALVYLRLMMEWNRLNNQDVNADLLRSLTKRLDEFMNEDDNWK